DHAAAGPRAVTETTSGCAAATGAGSRIPSSLRSPACPGIPSRLAWAKTARSASNARTCSVMVSLAPTIVPDHSCSISSWTIDSSRYEIDDAPPPEGEPLTTEIPHGGDAHAGGFTPRRRRWLGGRVF